MRLTRFASLVLAALDGADLDELLPREPWLRVLVARAARASRP